jgi:hypothetical protein
MPFLEIAQVALNLLDGGARVIEAVRLGQVGQLLDGPAGVEHRAGTDVGGPLVQIRQAGIDDTRIEDIGTAVQLGHGLAVGRSPNVVTADDEVGWAVQVEAVEQRQGGHQPGRIHQAAPQGRQAQGHGGTDTAEGADQPQTDSSFTHGCFLKGPGKSASLLANGVPGPFPVQTYFSQMS